MAQATKMTTINRRTAITAGIASIAAIGGLAVPIVHLAKAAPAADAELNAALAAFRRVEAERGSMLTRVQELQARLTAKRATPAERVAYGAACNKLAELGARYDAAALAVYAVEPQTAAGVEAKLRFHVTSRGRLRGSSKRVPVVKEACREDYARLERLARIRVTPKFARPMWELPR
jgi:hypothetical protein